jgi:hypothetical protein
MKHRTAILAVAILILAAAPVMAATSAANTNTISPTLKVNVTVQSAIGLTLAQGAGCAVNSGGGADYNMSFGNVDALGINAPTCGSQFAPTTPGVSNSAYYSDYKLTPVFTSQPVSTNTVKAYVSTNFAKANLSIVYATAAPGNIGALSAMSTSAAAQSTLATNAASGTALTQYIGVEVAPTNGAGLTGADSAITAASGVATFATAGLNGKTTTSYTLTVQ